MNPPAWSVVVAPNPSPLTGRGTNTYVAGAGDGVVVIDPGPDDAGHLEATESAASERGRVSAVLLTHHHLDHVEGATRLAGRLGAPVLAYGHPALALNATPVGDGAVIDFVGGRMQALHTPGHCSDHLCFHWTETGDVFCGDLVAGEGFIVIDPPDGDMDNYLGSLRRIRDLAPGRLLPGHGPSIDEPVAYLDRYIAHRLEREAKVLAALSSLVTTASDDAAVSLDQLLPLAYDDVDPAMHPIARRSLLAHLQKLVRDGRVRAVEGAEELYRPAG